jgi:uncharacterized protein (TIGR00369 family)
MSHTKAHPFEPEFVEALRTMFEQRIVFNQVLGLHITSFSPKLAQGTMKMRPELIGSFTHQRLHGGAISAALDAIGGLAVMLAIAEKHLDDPPQSRMQRFSKVGTIDLRVDYLRPAQAESFVATGHVLRLGGRVATTRMDFFDNAGVLLAAGSAAYIVA